MLAYQLCLDATWQLEQQHKGAAGYVSIAQKQHGWHERYYLAGALPAVNGGTDIYNSQNTFVFPSRRTAHIKQFRTLFCDIDCYRVGLTPDQALWQLEHDYFGSKLPVPNMVTMTGQGLALIWYLKPAPAAAMPLWQFAEDWICTQLESLGADSAATDAARVLRLAGTVNSKNGATVQAFECHNHKLDLKDWKRDWLPTQREKPLKNVANKPRSVSRLLNVYTLNYQRMLDIKTLVNLRVGDCDGYRELIVFLYRYYGLLYYKDKKSALDSVLYLNNKFKSPLPWRQVVRDTRSAERILERGRQYNYSNRKLINLLDITLEEQRYLKTIISTAEKYRRNNEKRENARRTAGQLDRREYLSTQQKTTQDRIVAIRKLLEQQPGIKQAEIAAQLGIGQPRVSRLMKQI
jgi:hypothetical protein